MKPGSLVVFDHRYSKVIGIGIVIGTAKGYSRFNLWLEILCGDKIMV